MRRTPKDPRVVRTLRALDTAIASPRAHTEHFLPVLSMLLTFGDNSESLKRQHGWTPDSARNTVLALAMSVPDPLLDRLAAVADRQYRFVRRWDRRGYLEAEIVGGGDGMSIREMKCAIAAAKACPPDKYVPPVNPNRKAIAAREARVS